MAVDKFVTLPIDAKEKIMGLFLNDLGVLSNTDTATLLSKRGRVSFTEEISPFKLTNLINLVIARSQLPKDTAMAIFDELVENT